ncbi:carbohydrate-binding protein CenC, partial [Priestia megaterium]|nr:carbohydrate-binding protein CenC [Priestia megaterium]
MAPLATGTFSLIDMNDAIVSGTAPTNPTDGTLWLDTSVTPNMMKKWGGSSWVDIGELDPNYSDTIENINKSIDDITSDSVIDYTERKILKDRITEIIGYVIADNATTLPAASTLDSSGKGELYTVRKQALNAGISSADTTYIEV